MLLPVPPLFVSARPMHNRMLVKWCMPALFKCRSVFPAVWKECFDRDGGICRHCGKGGVLQAAHYVSRARGGMGIPTNLVMLCPECHREADQGDGKEIKREMREYLQSIYPLWSEENQKYTKGTGR